MATEFNILHLQFEPPEPFSHETEKFRFEENPFSSGRRLEVVTGEDQMPASHFQKWLGRSFNNVELEEDRERDGYRVLRARAESPSSDPVQALTARVSEQSGTRLRFLSVGNKLGKVWESTLNSMREEEEGHHGWLKDGPRRYQVNGVSLEVPGDWQDTTQYLLTIGSSSNSTLEVSIRWEEEPNLTPQERVQSFLRGLQAAGRSIKIREDQPLRIDDHSGYYGSLIGVEAGSRVRGDLVALKTGEEHGVLLYTSGSEKAFSEYNNHWENLLSEIDIR